jgi:hypothetical protein
VIESGGTLMTSVKFLLFVPDAESFTVTVTGKLPAVGGVPVICPVDELMESDAGISPTALHVYGGWPPVADIVNEYGLPTNPEGSDDVEISRPAARSSGAEANAKINTDDENAACTLEIPARLFHGIIVVAPPAAPVQMLRTLRGR